MTILQMADERPSLSPHGIAVAPQAIALLEAAVDVVRTDVVKEGFRRGKGPRASAPLAGEVLGRDGRWSRGMVTRRDGRHSDGQRGGRHHHRIGRWMRRAGHPGCDDDALMGRCGGGGSTGARLMNGSLNDDRGAWRSNWMVGRLNKLDRVFWELLLMLEMRLHLHRWWLKRLLLLLFRKRLMKVWLLRHDR